jgi:hypothetical protein
LKALPAEKVFFNSHHLLCACGDDDLICDFSGVFSGVCCIDNDNDGDDDNGDAAAC